MVASTASSAVAVMQRIRRIEEIVARIYEGVCNPGSWDDLLVTLVDQLGGDSALIYLKPRCAHVAGTVVASHGFGRNYRLGAYLSYYEARSPLIPFFKQTPVGRARALGQYAFSAIYRETEFYQDWMRPQRIGDMLGSHLVRDGELYAWFAIRRPDRHRGYSAAEVRVADQVASHLARAIKLRFKLDNELACAYGARRSLDLVSFGIFVLDASGKVLMANRAGEAILRLSDGLKCRDGRLSCWRSHETAALQGAIRAIVRGARAPAELYLTRDEGRRPYTVHVMPVISPTAWKGFAPASASVTLFVVDPHVPSENVEGMATAYALTPAECRVLREIMRCRGLVEAAGKLGIALPTARTHLQRIFSKTNTSNQAELVRLAMAMSLAPAFANPRRDDR